MQLKSIELQGFKSFPEKTRLAFEKPVTVIVGPNGSGKSNLADAILWVMGEQSTRTLRGGKMEDVIFGGTQKRAQVGFAEVSLILDNLDGTLPTENTEVMITRRYYRSGESEYYINRKLSRLRDINELLMDTGLGREGYSVIGQGKIDDILSAKSHDRRLIFEEAVGISRYRHRKEEAEHRLAQTDENLVRINDIIAELELQLTPLREQSETARRYLRLRDELRELEVSLWALNLDKLAERIEKSDGDHNAAAAQLAEMTRALEDGYENAETFAQRLRDKDVEADAVREAVSDRERRSGELESAIAALKTQRESNHIRIGGIEQELSRQESRDGGLESQLREREARIEQIAAERGDAEARLRALEETMRQLAETSSREENEFFALAERETSLGGTAGERRERLSALALQAQELLDRENGAGAELGRLSEEMDALAVSSGEAEASLSEAREEDASLLNVVNGFLLRENSRREKAAEAEDKRTRLSLELGAMKSRIAMLTEMENEYQGYSKAVRLVMSDASRGILKNIYGTVAGLVKTSDKYAVAIETALGGSTQSVLVGTEEDGKAAIGMLKRRDGGRATFLPVSTIRGNLLRENGLSDEDGFEGVAAGLIEYDKKYEGVYANLLGRVAIVATLDDAIRIARKYGNRFKLVTLDGQVMNAGGSMTGGSVSKSAGIISRANELKQLSEQEQRLSGNLKTAEQDAAERARELSAAAYELETARAEKRVIEDRLLKLESEREHLAQLADDKKRDLDARKALLQALRARITENDGEVAALRGEIAALEKDADAVRAELSRRGAVRERASSARDEALGASSELRASVAALDAERGAVSGALHELRAIREDLVGARASQEELARELEGQNRQINVEILEKERGIAALGGEIDAQKRRVSEITAEKLAIEAERVRSDRDVREKNAALLDLERECARLEQRKLTFELEEKQLVDKLWDTYELSRSDALAQRREVESAQTASKRVTELKREITSLGNPNIGAIEEFERVNTRYTYLAVQRDDVEKAKGELDTIIADITVQMRDIFAREFKVIDESFKETFLALFGGGRAALILEEPDDILNCGIEIEVQPPGKSLKTLTLLSGGEKAFVAIALYFAILKVRPTPFVVLDEIEAALDDANVQRFAEYMRRMSAKTQMIVISHRRGTMEEADVLYGVTMQELGVSRILSIDLEEAERTAAKNA